jgi:hypothetical protein
MESNFSRGLRRILGVGGRFVKQPQPDLNLCTQIEDFRKARSLPTLLVFHELDRHKPASRIACYANAWRFEQ